MPSKILASLSALLTLDPKGFEAGLKKSKASAGAFQKSISAIGPAIAGAFSVAAIVQFSKVSQAAYADQIKSESKLLTALKGRQDVADALVSQAGKLQATTLFSDDEIINAQALLSTFTQSENEIKRLIPLILDYATAFGLDLDTAVKQIGKSLIDTNGLIGRTGIEAEGSAGSTERFASVIQLLTDKFKDQAENAIPKQLKEQRKMNVSFDELKETWGQFVTVLAGAGVYQAASNGLNGVAERIRNIGGALNGVKDIFDKAKGTDFGGFLSNLFGYNASTKYGQTFNGGIASMPAPNPELTALTEGTWEQLMGDVSAKTDGTSFSLEGLSTSVDVVAKSFSDATDNLSAFAEAMDDVTVRASTYEKPNVITYTGSGGADNGAGAGQMSGFMTEATSNIEAFTAAMIESGTQISTYNDLLDQMAQQSQMVADVTYMMTMSLVDSLFSIAEGSKTFGEAMEDMLKDILRFIVSIIAAKLAETIAASVASGAEKGGAIGAAVEGAAGAAVFMGMVPALNAFADGGMVYGPTMGVMGEYPGAATNPEVIAPLSDLEAMLGGGGSGSVEFKIRGEDLYYLMKKQESKQNRY